MSAGDSGYGVAYPVASRYVTAVGGTSLKPGTNSRGWTETAWGGGSGAGTGSGCSADDAKPTWQKDKGCTRRTIADVSAVADPNSGVAEHALAHAGASARGRGPLQRLHLEREFAGRKRPLAPEVASSPQPDQIGSQVYRGLQMSRCYSVPRDHAIIVLAIQTGLRISERAGLTGADLVPGTGPSWRRLRADAAARMAARA